ncbi:hypothetical protein [Xenorhabdus hominickii]|uniref:hypothetical protein n=1 Tax=Xenorhabdus hominickii TaxID=351679 RepID=UPI0011AB3C51|nr:hypothetical protein [Xenorhabdus hominickii]
METGAPAEAAITRRVVMVPVAEMVVIMEMGAITEAEAEMEVGMEMGQEMEMEVEIVKAK